MLGLAESGKSTIIRSVVEGITPRLGERYKATIRYQRKRTKIADTEIAIFDLGGQVIFLDRFIGDLAEFIFSETNAFIFVVEPMKVAEFSRAKYYLEISLEKLQLYSPNALVYIFLHKMDLIPVRLVANVSNNVKKYFTYDIKREYQIFETSVFTESIFTAVGNILGELTDIRVKLYSILEKFLQENESILHLAQVLSKQGAVLITLENSSLEKIFAKQTKELFDSALRHFTISKEIHEYDNIESIESENLITFTSFLENGLALLIAFSKKGLRENSKEAATIYNRITSLSKQISQFK